MFAVPHSVKSNLLAAFRYLLRPLVRLAVKNAVAFPEFAEVLKQAYVDVAAKQIAASGKAPTEEGISLIANVTTTDVRHILQSAGDANLGVAAQEHNPLPTILNAWHTNPKYTGPYGVVRDIPFSRAEGATDAYTFSQLAADYCPGVSPQELLDELIRTGCVQDVGNGFYRAVKRSYVPDPLSARSILLFARVCTTFAKQLK